MLCNLHGTKIYKLELQLLRLKLAVYPKTKHPAKQAQSSQGSIMSTTLMQQNTLPSETRFSYPERLFYPHSLPSPPSSPHSSEFWQHLEACPHLLIYLMHPHPLISAHLALLCTSLLSVSTYFQISHMTFSPCSGKFYKDMMDNTSGDNKNSTPFYSSISRGKYANTVEARSPMNPISLNVRKDLECILQVKNSPQKLQTYQNQLYHQSPSQKQTEGIQKLGELECHVPESGNKT
nr:hypothetical protein Iba_chr14aCG22380 [Ipomoea batatas]